MRLIVLFPGALGDLCLLAPALAALTARGDCVELSVQRTLAPVAVQILPDIALAPPIDGEMMAGLFADPIAPTLGAWLRRADRVHAWLARADADGRVRARVAALGAVAEWHAVPRSDGERHVGDEYAAAFGLGVLPAPLRVTVLPIPPIVPSCVPAPARLLVHPGAGARAKRWSAEGFRLVADAWISGGGETAVVLGPAEEDEARWWRANGTEPVVGLGLGDAISLIASAPLWVGNDSGMSHLAGVLGRRGAVLFGPTRAARWRPRGAGLVSVDHRGRSLAAVAEDVRVILAAARDGVA